MGNDLWEHADSVKDWTEDGGDLLNEGISSQEDGVLLGPLLDGFLFLVESLEGIKINNVDV